MSEIRPVECWLTDMDGVLVREDQTIPGAAEFIDALVTGGHRFQVLTNNSIFTPRDLRARLHASGIDIPEDAIWTSALATAQFLDSQRAGGSAYVVGEAGLTTARTGLARQIAHDDSCTDQSGSAADRLDKTGKAECRH